ncbi:MAG: zinc-binding alcohol dehydrogenase family protein [Candidatus Latescibacteria bacterium]|nr:zinc-binding alcohol dehydrogenase family protein [Candidatus Latescibacterota bacterium]
MRTIVLEEPGRFVRGDTESPGAIPNGHARVRVHRVGICGSDLHAYRGRQPFFSYPRIVGHELGVEVLEVAPDVQGLAPGGRCAVEPYLNCGTCIACKRGKTNCCAELEVMGVHVDGGMREEIVVPADKLHASATLSDDQLALVETLGIGAHAVGRANPRPDESVLVMGAGPIGLSVIQFAQVTGAQVIVVELSAQRLAFCRDQFGVGHAVDGNDQPLEHVREILNGDLPEVVFDATGSPASMMTAFDYVANGGRLTLVGLVQSDITFFDPEFHRRELTLLSSRNAVGGDLSRVIGLMERGEIDTGPWITHRTDYDSLIEEFPALLEPEQGLVKAIMCM